MRSQNLKKWKWASVYVYKECFLMKYWGFNILKTDSFNQESKWCLSSCADFSRWNESIAFCLRVTSEIEEYGQCKGLKLKIRWLSLIFSLKSNGFHIINKDTRLENLLNLKWTNRLKCLTLKRTKVSIERINWNLIAILKVLFKWWQNKQNYSKRSSN